MMFDCDLSANKIKMQSKNVLLNDCKTLKNSTKIPEFGWTNLRSKSESWTEEKEEEEEEEKQASAMKSSIEWDGENTNWLND